MACASVRVWSLAAAFTHVENGETRERRDPFCSAPLLLLRPLIVCVCVLGERREREREKGKKIVGREGGEQALALSPPPLRARARTRTLIVRYRFGRSFRIVLTRGRLVHVPHHPSLIWRLFNLNHTCIDRIRFGS